MKRKRLTLQLFWLTVFETPWYNLFTTPPFHQGVFENNNIGRCQRYRTLWLSSRSNPWEVWGTLSSLTLPFFDWPGNDRLIKIPEMKISLTNYCFCFCFWYCWCCRCRRRHRSCWPLLLTAASVATITTIILQSFALFCKLGLYCYLKITRITKVKYPCGQFITFTSSWKWSINLALPRDRLIMSKHNVKMSKWQKTERFKLIIQKKFSNSLFSQ